ncbi:hypothetical protein EVA_10438 [gut metagenome]|uniref:Uncharacterized protein n=1 Tax=gut metagenome TaxID=749906 RepID=J9GNH5_9ZZZZ
MKERFVLGELDKELRDTGQFGIVGIAQGGRIDDALQVSDGFPGSSERESCLFQRFGDLFPGCRRFGGRHLGDGVPQRSRQSPDGRGNMFWLDMTIVDQIVNMEERIVFHHEGILT